jgi:iron(III) transport system permease protein
MGTGVAGAWRRPGSLLGASAVLIALLLSVPLWSVFSSVFSSDAGAWAHIRATILPDLIGNSLLLALSVGLGVTIIGTTTAWLTAHFEFRGRATFEWMLILPLAMPAYVMAYAYTDALQYAGPVQTALREWMGWQARGDYWFPDVRSLGGAAVMLMCVLYPYVYVLARVAFIEQSASLAEAGRTFGLARMGIFRHVSLPLARPAIAAGAALALMETLADYGTVSYFGIPTFTTGIFNAWFSQGDRVSAAKLAVILLIFVACVVAAEQAARRRLRFHQGIAARQSRTRLKGPAQWLATTACLLPLLLGFAIPLLILLRLAFTGGDSTFGVRFVHLAFNSFGVAGLTAILAVGVALMLAYAARLSRQSWSVAVNRAVSLGYAVPGTVIAVGVMLPLATLDHTLAALLENLSGQPWPLLLTGSILALIYAYLIRFLAVALQSVEAGLSKITPAMDDAARSLGAGAPRVALAVHVPLLKKSLITAALLVFVDVMKELPATLVLRPFNFDTLAVQAYNLAMDERLAEASTASLCIVAVGLIPVIMASRAITRPAQDAGATIR